MADERSTMERDRDAAEEVATPTSEEEVARLAAQVAHGLLSAEAYFMAIERRAAGMIDRETTGGSWRDLLIRARAARQSRTA